MSWLIVGIFVKLKAARCRYPGDKKAAQAASPSHEPAAESAQYRIDSGHRNNIFADSPEDRFAGPIP
jgi:hypothetical protein